MPGSGEQHPEILSDHWVSWNHGPDCPVKSNHLSHGYNSIWMNDHQRHSSNYSNQRKTWVEKVKNQLITSRSKTIPTKIRGPTAARLEHPNIDATKENNPKTIFRRIVEAIKEEIKKCLKEM